LSKSSWQDVWLLVGLAILGIALSRLQTAARTAGRTDVISAGARMLVMPAAKELSSSANGLADWSTALVHARRLEDENRRLRALEIAAQNYEQDADRLQAEIDELRKLGGWEQAAGREKVPADVIGFFPQENRLTVDVGANRGLKPGMPVATYEGLVGRIETVDRTTAQVLLITSPAAEGRISAIVERDAPNPPPAGLLHGEGPDSMVLDLADPTATVKTGDIVETSGFSAEIPRGIVIGKVIQVQADPVYGKLTATIFPRVALGEVREVMVIK